MDLLLPLEELRQAWDRRNEMKSKKRLSSEHLSYQCPLRIEDFTNDGSGYHCAKCDREILDLTECTLEEAIKLQQTKGPICGLVYAVGAAAILGASSCSSIQSESFEDKRNTGEIGSRSIPVPGYLCPPEQLKSLNGDE